MGAKFYLFRSLVLGSALFVLGAPAAQAQFVCGGRMNDGEPQNGGGANGTGSTANFACGIGANASGAGFNTAIRFDANASFVRGNVATGHHADARGDDSSNANGLAKGPLVRACCARQKIWIAPNFDLVSNRQAPVRPGL